MADRDRHRAGLTCALVALAAALCVPAVAGAAEFRAGLADDRPPDGCAVNGCTLREAVQAANARPGPDVIRLDGGREYRLGIEGSGEDAGASGDLDVTDPVRIVATRSSRALVDAGGIDRALDVHARAELVRLEITGGRAPVDLDPGGAAVRSSDAGVVLRRSRIRGNDGPQSAVEVSGGGLAVRDSAIVRNAGTGLIARGAGEVQIVGSRASRNTGAGIQAFGDGGIRLDRSEVSDNLLAGIQEFGPGDLALVGVEAERNGGQAARETEGGGLFVRGSRLRRNAATAVAESGSGSVNVFSSRVSGNGSDAVLELGDGGVSLKRARLTANGGVGVSEFGVGGVTVELATIRGGAQGGVAERDEGGVELSASTIRGSGGNGVVARGPGVSILTRATIRGHEGIGLHLGADANALRTRVVENDGGIELVAGRLVLARSAIARNHGEFGGIALRGAAILALKQSTVSGNSSEGDGGGVMVADQGELEALNSTIAGNRADGAGGGVGVAAEATVRANAVTIARNHAGDDALGLEEGGGIAVASGASAEVENSLLAANGARGDGPDCAGTFVSGGGNLVGEAGGCEGFEQATDLLGAHPWLGALRRNGGPTATIALLPRSPAIGAAGESAPARDQRGVRRRDPDSGAFERR